MIHSGNYSVIAFVILRRMKNNIFLKCLLEKMNYDKINI